MNEVPRRVYVCSNPECRLTDYGLNVTAQPHRFVMRCPNCDTLTVIVKP